MIDITTGLKRSAEVIEVRLCVVEVEKGSSDRYYVLSVF